MKTDVCIAGGGPAGLATALALRQRGISVMVADAMKPPIDKACGEGLMPDSLRDLAALGVALSAEDGAEFRGIRFVNHFAGPGASKRGVEIATAHFPALSFNSGLGIGLRRQTLHSRLVAKAEECGVDLRWQSPVQLMPEGRVLVGREPVEYGLLVGADGLSSRVRSWAGLERGSIASKRFGFRRHYKIEPWSQYVEVHWGRSGQAYVTPVGANEVCVATVVRDPHMRVEALLDELPLLRERLTGAAAHGPRQIQSDRERGALTTTRRLRRVTAGRVALVGDASGSADAITGEGMGLAFRQALLLAECVEAGDLSRYQHRHRQILRLPQTMARVMLQMDRSAGFRNRALGLLTTRPELFTRLLGVHMGAEPLVQFAARKGIEVAWRLAIPLRG